MSTHPVMLKLQWAEKRLHELDGLLGDFGSYPAPFVIERDAQTNELLYRLASDPIIPRDVPLLAGEVLQSLRSALDYLAFALVVADGNKPHSGTYFPISKSAPGSKGYDDAFAGKVRGMSKSAISLIESLKPYKGGDGYLWRVHELNNREKHRLLFTVGAYMRNFSVTQHIDATNPPLEVIERMARACASDDTWIDIRKATYPLKAGDILLTDRPDAKPNYDAQFFIQVALNEPGIFEGEPLFSIVWFAFHGICNIVSKFKGMY